jgi:hypothetical protein
MSRQGRKNSLPSLEHAVKYPAMTPAPMGSQIITSPLALLDTEECAPHLLPDAVDDPVSDVDFEVAVLTDDPRSAADFVDGQPVGCTVSAPGTPGFDVHGSPLRPVVVDVLLVSVVAVVVLGVAAQLIVHRPLLGVGLFTAPVALGVLPR